MTIEFLLCHHVRNPASDALAMAEKTLQKMAQGGMYDQIGGGFARYSVDHRWLVPHFEKMLYDNAQLARAYLHAWQITGNGLYRRIVEETLDYVLREMRHEQGGFYSSQDADSEGVEGKFYVWSASEIRDALGDDADLFMRIYGVSDEGNWEGHNILNLHLDPRGFAEQMGIAPEELGARMANDRAKLYALRSTRVWPGLDDKVLTAWNGLMMAAFADAGCTLGRTDYVDAAVANAEFIRRTMRRESGRLLRTWKAGSEAKYNAYLEDYAFLADGLLTLYEATFEPRWFEWAVELVGFMRTHFVDEKNGGFFDTSDDHETLIHRPKDLQDNAVPSGNAVTASVLMKLYLLTGDSSYQALAERSVETMTKLMSEYPSGFGEWLKAASFMLSEPREIALVGSPQDLAPLLEVVRRQYMPFQVVAAGEADSTAPPLLRGRTKVDGRGTAYICRHFVCEAPVTNPAAFERQLSD